MVNAQDSKTYRPKNLKFVLNLFLLLFFSVAILLYLFSINTFVPYSTEKHFNWINIFTFSSLVFSIIFSIATLFIYSLLTVILKKGGRYLKIFCIKWSLLFSTGLMLVLILNFLHILDIYWGVGILIVVIILSFII